MRDKQTEKRDVPAKTGRVATLTSTCPSTTMSDVKLKRVELLMKHYLRAMGCRLPYGITQESTQRTQHKNQHCFPTQVNTPHLEAGTQFTDWRDGRLSWPRWLVTYQDGLPTPIWVLTRQWMSNLHTCWSQVRHQATCGHVLFQWHWQSTNTS